jgi:hypothetical protein
MQREKKKKKERKGGGIGCECPLGLQEEEGYVGSVGNGQKKAGKKTKTNKQT